MSLLVQLTEKLQNKTDLTPEEAAQAAEALTKGQSPDSASAFLTALHQKGESVEEVVAFASVFRELALDPGLDEFSEQAIDIVGTGGSGSGGYNISSATAILLASAGVKVLKHGNRAITSKSGSADFLSVLGVKIQSDPSELKRAIEELNFCFFFAPAFHPAFKEIMPIRKAMAAEGKRSIFNILGPLINPAKPKHQLLGVFHQDWVKPLANSLTQLGMKRGLVVSGELSSGKFIDEITTSSTNHVSGIGELSSINETWTAEQFGFEDCPEDSIQGGSPEENVAIFKNILEGKGSAGLTDTLILNVACGFYITGKTKTVQEGKFLALELLNNKEPLKWLNKAESFYRSL